MAKSTNQTAGPMSSNVFPVKLYHLLEDVTSKHEKLQDVVSWCPDGKSFKIHNKERFTNEIIPVYFGPLKYRSFQKNLNMWDFTAARSGECSHPQFLRDNEASVYEMKRQPVKRQPAKKKRSDAAATSEAAVFQNLRDHQAKRLSLSSSDNHTSLLMGLGQQNQGAVNSTTGIFKSTVRDILAGTPPSPMQPARRSLLEEVLYRRMLVEEIQREQARLLLQERRASLVSRLQSLTGATLDILASDLQQSSSNGRGVAPPATATARSPSASLLALSSSTTNPLL